METLTARDQKQSENGYAFSNTNFQNQNEDEAVGNIAAQDEYQGSGVDSVEDLANDEAFANLDNESADTTEYDAPEDEQSLEKKDEEPRNDEK